MRRELIDGADLFGRAYLTEVEMLGRTTPASSWRRAESAWAGWLDQNLDGFSEGELYDEGLRLWRSHPEYRGETLYLLAGLEPYDLVRPGLVDWPQFDRIFGSPIDAAAYSAYLRQGPLAISHLARALRRDGEARRATLSFGPKGRVKVEAPHFRHPRALARRAEASLLESERHGRAISREAQVGASEEGAVSVGTR